MSYSDLYGGSTLSSDNIESPNATIINLTCATLNGYNNDNITVNASLILPSPNNFIGNLAGNLTGNGIGDWIGNVTGNLTGNVTGNVMGNITGTATNFSGVLDGDIIGTQFATQIATGIIVNSDISDTAAISDTKLNTISISGKVANSATTATSSNNNNTIVARDNSGNFSANIITASLNGNASTSTTTEAFSGTLSGDIIGTQSATQIASGVIVNADINTSAAIADTKLDTISTAGKVANSATTATTNANSDTIVLRNSSGGISSNTITTTAGTGVGVAHHIFGNNSSIPRWALGLFNSESGNNSGSDFVFFNYSDTGAFINSPIQLKRSDGSTSFYGNISTFGTATLASVTTSNINSTNSINIQTNGNFNLNYAPIVNAQTISVGSGSGNGWSAEKITIRTNNYTDNGKISMGRVANELEIGIIGIADDYLTGSLPGDVTIRNINNTNRLLLGINTTPILIVNSSGLLVKGSTTCQYLATNIGTGTDGSGQLHLALQTTDGVIRFGHGLYNLETGSNNGGDYVMWRYGDVGNYLDTVYTINRASGLMTTSNTNANGIFNGIGNFSNISSEIISVKKPANGSHTYTLTPGKKVSLMSNSYYGGLSMNQSIFSLTSTGWANGCCVNGIISITNNPSYSSTEVQNCCVKFIMNYAQGTATITQISNTNASTASSTMNISLTWSSNQLMLSITSGSNMQLCWEAYYDVIVNQNLKFINGSGTSTIFTLTNTTYTVG